MVLLLILATGETLSTWTSVTTYWRRDEATLYEVKMPKVFTSGVGTFPENLETSLILYFKNHATSYLKGFEHYSMGQYLSRVVPLNLISSLFLVIVQNHISFS